MSTSDRLQEAIGTGEVLTITYDGGSQPGASREVIPLQINGDKVRCRCYTSKGYAAKEFKIDKITILTEPLQSGDGSAWSRDQQRPKYTTLDEVQAAHGEALKAVGWTAERWSDDDGEGLALFITAKPRKRSTRPTVTLEFAHTAYDEDHEVDGSITRSNPRPRTRPWGVRGKPGLKSLGTWKSLDEAVDRFLRAAEKAN